jgi:RNA polymerase sigma-70 factor (ECF subfamily)
VGGKEIMNRLKGYVSALRDDSAGDRTEEFVRLLSQYQTLIRGFLFTLLPNRTEADDLFQRTSIVLWRKFDQFQVGSDFGAWACQIAKFEVRNFLRVERRDRLCFSDELLTSLADIRLALDNELELRREALRHCLGKLRRIDRQIIHQCYGPESTTAKDAADRLGRPANTLYKALIRIRRALFECIERTLKASER